VNLKLAGCKVVTIHLTLPHNRLWAWRKLQEILGLRITERHKNNTDLSSTDHVLSVSYLHIGDPA
jgi:hypothetical protein